MAAPRCKLLCRRHIIQFASDAAAENTVFVGWCGWRESSTKLRARVFPTVSGPKALFFKKMQFLRESAQKM